MPCDQYVTLVLGQCDWYWKHIARTPSLKHTLCDLQINPMAWGSRKLKEVSDCINFNFFLCAVHVS